MPQLSDIIVYKFGCPLQIVLDVSDAPGATYESATFCRDNATVNWDLIDNEAMGRVEYSLSPNLLIIYLIPVIPKDQEAGDSSASSNASLGSLSISVRYDDPKVGSTVVQAATFKVRSYDLSCCQVCESYEKASGLT